MKTTPDTKPATDGGLPGTPCYPLVDVDEGEYTVRLDAYDNWHSITRSEAHKLCVSLLDALEIPIVGNAMRLAGQLRMIHENPEYRAVWECAQNHRGQYSGPKYNVELEQLERAIAAACWKPLPEESSSADNVQVEASSEP